MTDTHQTPTPENSAEISADAPFSHVLRVADLPARKPTRFDIAPEGAAAEAIAADLGLISARKLRLAGTLTPMGKSDFRLEATLGATVVQPCVVTLDPVTTRIDADISRLYIKGYADPDTGGEVEMPDDDSAEALGAEIDLGALLSEALALELPLYPRATGAQVSGAQVAEPGVAPMTDEDAKPFAGLKALRDQLQKDD